MLEDWLDLTTSYKKIHTFLGYFAIIAFFKVCTLKNKYKKGKKYFFLEISY